MSSLESRVPKARDRGEVTNRSGHSAASFAGTGRQDVIDPDVGRDVGEDALEGQQGLAEHDQVRRGAEPGRRTASSSRPISQENPGNWPRRTRRSQRRRPPPARPRRLAGRGPGQERRSVPAPRSRLSPPSMTWVMATRSRLPERARQAPVEDGEPAVGGHEQVPRVRVGVERGPGCGRPDRAGDQCLDDQLGEPPPIRSVRGRPARSPCGRRPAPWP